MYYILHASITDFNGVRVKILYNVIAGEKCVSISFKNIFATFVFTIKLKGGLSQLCSCSGAVWLQIWLCELQLSFVITLFECFFMILF